jgi:hypothetical protein
MYHIVAECYDLGRIAYTNADYYHTLMWMQEALDHLEREPNHTTVNKIDILDHLAYATSKVRYSIIFQMRFEEFLFFFSKEIWNML